VKRSAIAAVGAAAACVAAVLLALPTLAAGSGPTLQLSFVQQPTDVLLGAPITPPVSLSLTKDGGTPVPGVTVTVSLAPNAAGGTLSGKTSAVTDASGIATFTGLSVSHSGTAYQLVAAAQSLTTTSSPFNVAAILQPCSNGCNFSTADPTPSNPTGVQVLVPSGSGSSTAANTQLEVILDPSTPTFCGGSPCVGSLVTVIPPSTVGAPILVRLLYDGTITSGREPSTFKVWKTNGTGAPQLVPDCVGASPVLPCVSGRRRLANSTLAIEVRFSGPDPIWGSG
jgi:hypothetical protein